MAKRITLEEAQNRVNQLNRKLKIIEWNGTTKPCKVVCTDCGISFTYSKGATVYSSLVNGDMYGCNNCLTYIRNIDLEINELTKLSKRQFNDCYVTTKIGYHTLDSLKILKQLYDNYKDGKIEYYVWNKELKEYQVKTIGE